MDTANNPYLTSSYMFFKESASLIQPSMLDEGMKYEEVVQATLNFAIGIERLLKAILFDINPTYVLASPEFGHSVKVLYRNRVIDFNDKESVLVSKPVADVITFRNSLLRCSAISNACQKNKNRLFSLSNFRDIIVHHELRLFDELKARELLQRDFYFILLDFIDELRLSKEECFGSHEETLIYTSRLLQKDLKNILRLKLEEYRANWDSIHLDHKKVAEKLNITNELLESKDRNETICPACYQRAVLFVETDFVVDNETTEKHSIGEFPRLIHCEFCGLHINDPLELDQLGYGRSLNPKKQILSPDDIDEIPF